MSPSRAAEQRLHEFADSLIGLTEDGVVVKDATAVFEERPEVGDTIIRLRLGLSDPPPELPTWPFKALRSLERAVRERSYGVGFDEFVYVDFRETGERDAADDEEEPSRRGDLTPSTEEGPEVR